MGERREEKVEPRELAETLPPSNTETDGQLSVDETRLFSEREQTIQAYDEPDYDSLKPSQDEIPGFRIVEELGRGAFGIVYRALDSQLDRSVAIKIPLINDQELAEKYIQEARNAARIESPGIVPVYQVGSTHEGQPFVVQRLIDGCTLRSLLKGMGQLSAGRAVNYIHKISLAIAGAHQAGLVHRDLKPANILIDKQDQPWVADFGLAVFEEDQRSMRGEVAGTPLYMAPEQLEGRVDWLDGRADIWSIGIIMYELMTGKPPFDATEFLELKDQILNRHPRPLSQRLNNVPAELDDIFNHCCAKQINDRYASALELAGDLEQILADSAMDFGDSSVLPAYEGGPSSVRSRRLASNTVQAKSRFGKSTVALAPSDRGTMWLAFSVAALALVGLIGFGVIWWQLQDSSPPSEFAPELAESETLAPQTPSPQILRVSKTDTDAHQSLSNAVEAAKPGDTIAIGPGDYRESLTVSKNLILVGEGARENVTLKGIDAAAITIAGGAVLELSNLTIEADGEEINTIEVLDGQLNIRSCRVNSSSYDCVKVHPSASLRLASSVFESTLHPAIVAKRADELQIKECEFRFDLASSNIKREDPVAGIELSYCGAVIESCTFTGIETLGKGVSCKETDELISIVDCQFNGLMHGIELFACSNVELTRLNTVSSCQLGLYAEASQAMIKDIDITSCDFGLNLLRGSEFDVENAKISDSSRVGVWVDNSRAQLDVCSIYNCQTVGILVDSETAQTALETEGCTLQGNGIGVLLVAGSVELAGGLLSQNHSASVAVISYEQLPDPLRRRPTPNAALRELVAKNIRINAKSEAPAILFNAIGSYRLEDCIIVDLPNNHRPALSDELTTNVDGPTTHVVRRGSPLPAGL